MGLRKPTQMVRRTVTQTGRQSYKPREGEPRSGRRDLSALIVGPEEGAPAGSTRRIVIILPENPGVSVVVGPQRGLGDGTDLPGVDDAGAKPEDVADGRTYQWPEPDAGRDYEFTILPEQWVAAISDDGIATVTVVVEYLE